MNNMAINDVIDDCEDDDELSSIQVPVSEQVTEQITKSFEVTAEQAGMRIDKVAVIAFSEFSRAQLQTWLKQDKLTVNGQSEKAKYRVKVGDNLVLDVKLSSHGTDLPENIALEVMYEDEDVLVINKPVGMVVHPGAGNWTGTLVNALLYHYPKQAHLPRAGLVHRIDKDTSGLLLVAKTKTAQLDLQAQLKDKSVYRHYRCIVAGDVASLMRHRTIDAPIGRHRTQRTKMAVVSTGKDAITDIANITALGENYALLDVTLQTGRTHQIRVHLSHVGHPLVGDAVYGSKRQLRAGLSEQQRQAIIEFPRQALHAYKLGFIHPTTSEEVIVTAPMPEDMQVLMKQLANVSS